jgi:hypothetical protein
MGVHGWMAYAARITIRATLCLERPIMPRSARSCRRARTATADGMALPREQVRRLATAASYRSEVTGVAVLLIARFSGDVAELTRAYDRAHAMIMAAGGAEQFGELRHHCATSQDALYIVGVWQSEEHVRTRWQSPEFEERLVSAGFPSPKTADITILDLRAIEPPL